MNAAHLENPKIQARIERAANQFAIDPHDREDIAQEIRIDLLNRLPDEKADETALVYLKCWSRAHRHVRDADRYAEHINYLLQVVEQADADEMTYDEALSDFLGGMNPHNSIEQEIENRQEMEIIKIIAQSLTAKQERILWLRLKGFSYGQIAKKLAILPQTVHENTAAIKKAFQRHSLAHQLFTEAIPL